MQNYLEKKSATPVLGIEYASEDKVLSSMLPSLSLSVRPTSAYLAAAYSPSIRIPHPAGPRKLLILDLNGTLLIRPKPRNARHRPIHPRPYMPTFRSYIFHKSVKPWLDVMVWSSAQPQNVSDMVARCFKDHRDDLKAMWARDTLGLSMADYSRKVQTTKDLEKCWSLGLFEHSAETTLLLDDSPLKAQLQPYNHFCVPEYTQNLSNRDLSTKLNLELHETRLEEAEVEAQVNLVSFPTLDVEPVMCAKKKLKRKKKRIAGFDPTLLAVMGVLDEIKEQTNVAGWIQAGGLWAGRRPPSSRTPPFELFSDDESIPTHEQEPNPGNDAVLGGEQEMWFDHKPCLDYWVTRGLQAAEVLGIQLDHGIDR